MNARITLGYHEFKSIRRRALLNAEAVAAGYDSHAHKVIIERIAYRSKLKAVRAARVAAQSA